MHKDLYMHTHATTMPSNEELFNLIPNLGLPFHKVKTFFICLNLNCIDCIFFFFRCTRKMWKFLGQRWNPYHSCNQSQSSDNAGSLTYWATRELQYFLIFCVLGALAFGDLILERLLLLGLANASTNSPLSMPLIYKPTNAKPTLWNISSIKLSYTKPIFLLPQIIPGPIKRFNLSSPRLA